MKKAEMLEHLAKRFDAQSESWRRAQDWEGTPWEELHLEDTLAFLYIELAAEFRAVAKQISKQKARLKKAKP